jgi:hypothetical protein
MKNTLKAITEQQIQITLKSKNSNDYKQHIEDIEVIGDLTLIKIALGRK